MQNFDHLWNAGSPGRAYAKALAGHAFKGAPELSAEAASPAMTDERAPGMTRGVFSQRLLLVAALLAGEFDAPRALFRLKPVGRATFAADRLDTGIALLHDHSLSRHGFPDQAVGLFTHRLFRHTARTFRQNF
jgi:hypothetical protein